MTIRAENEMTLVRVDNGEEGADGTTFYPSVSSEGVISWTNDGGKENPESRIIKGDDGQDGKSAYEAAVEAGYAGTEEDFNADLARTARIEQIESDLSGIEGRVEAAEGNISTVETAIGNPSDSASASGSLYARVKNAKNVGDQAIADIQAEVTRAQAAEQSAETAAANAQSSATAANTAANNAGRAAAIAQAAAEAAQGDIDDLETYFWHDSEGAHVLGNTYRTDVKDGLQVVRNSDGKILADFQPNGATFKSENGTQITHLGYGETHSGESVINSPYYDLGVRQPNSIIGAYSVIEGERTVASGLDSHTEGADSEATGSYSHAEGRVSKATGTASHSEGRQTLASGHMAHAEGHKTVASGFESHAEGKHTIAASANQHAGGIYNVEDTPNSDGEGKYARIIGNGDAENNRSNAYALDWNGNGYFAGDVYVGCNADSTGGNRVLAESIVLNNCTITDSGTALSVTAGASTDDGKLAQAIINTFDYVTAKEILEV